MTVSDKMKKFFKNFLFSFKMQKRVDFSTLFCVYLIKILFFIQNRNGVTYRLFKGFSAVFIDFRLVFLTVR